MKISQPEREEKKKEEKGKEEGGAVGEEGRGEDH